MTSSSQDRAETALHEAGHFVVARHLGATSIVSTINNNTPCGGQTNPGNALDPLDRVAVAMGGMLAENYEAAGGVTTGYESDMRDQAWEEAKKALKAHKLPAPTYESVKAILQSGVDASKVAHPELAEWTDLIAVMGLGAARASDILRGNWAEVKDAQSQLITDGSVQWSTPPAGVAQ